MNARRDRLIIAAGRLAVFAVVIAVWQGFAPKFDPLAVSPPSSVVRQLGSWASDGTLARNTEVTAREIGVGLLAGVLAGVASGWILGSSARLSAILDPLIVALYSIPKIALAPLLVVWFGIGYEPKYVLAATLVYFVVFYSTFHGVREVDRSMVNMAKVHGASKFQVLRLVVVPGSMSAVYLGIRLAVPQALFGAIVGEFIVSSEGLGYLVQYNATQLNTAAVYAALVTLTAFAVVITGIVNLLYRLQTRRTS